MTTEYLSFKRMEDMTKAAAKTLRFAGFKAKALSDWKGGDFKVVVRCSIDEVAQIKSLALFSNEIKIVNG